MASVPAANSVASPPFAAAAPRGSFALTRLSRDGRLAFFDVRLAADDDRYALRLVALADGAVLFEAPETDVVGAARRAVSLAVSDDAARVFVVADDGSSCLYDVARRDALHVFPPHSEGTWTLLSSDVSADFSRAVSVFGRSAATGSAAASSSALRAVVCDLSSGTWAQTPLRG